MPQPASSLTRNSKPSSKNSKPASKNLSKPASKNMRSPSQNMKPPSGSKNTKSHTRLAKQWKKEPAPARWPLAPLPPLESEDKDIREKLLGQRMEESRGIWDMGMIVEMKQRITMKMIPITTKTMKTTTTMDDDNINAQHGGKHCRKEKTRKIVKKLAWQSGYMTKQMFILEICHTIGKLVPRAVSLFTPLDNIMWAGACHSNKAIELGIEVSDHPYTTPNEKSFDILIKFIE
ncbi:hypothetical protein F5146DRAFT_1134376 [Armillaria mellea]|nr:hypothetical protein F5146DRAFT_1134376 [Armillaria mellea]